MKKLRITHIDNGVEAERWADDVQFLGPLDDPFTGRWPKVSFSNGTTYSYLYLTNTKVLFFTGLNKEVFTDVQYENLVKEFMASDREFAESNWCTQIKRVSTWKPEDPVIKAKAVA